MTHTTDGCHAATTAVTAGTVGCHGDNLRCQHWRQLMTLFGVLWLYLSTGIMCKDKGLVTPNGDSVIIGSGDWRQAITGTNTDFLSIEQMLVKDSIITKLYISRKCLFTSRFSVFDSNVLSIYVPNRIIVSRVCGSEHDIEGQSTRTR